MLIRSRAPVRIDFSGGWTDVALFCQETKGYVVNAAINIYSYATLQPSSIAHKNPTAATKLERVIDHSVKIYSADFDTYVAAEDVRKLEYDGNIDLVKAAIREMSSDGGMMLITQSNAPAGSGLGTSAAMGVALIGVLSEFVGEPLLPYEIAEKASWIERNELHIRGGKQDHYASAIGEINFMEFMDEEVKVSKLNLSPDLLFELEKNLVLCYTGKSRLSGNIHEKVADAFLNGNPDTVNAIENLKRISVDLKGALLKRDLGNFASLLHENWENQKLLHPSVTNPKIDELFEIAYQNGALGGKACGAGGGGCLLFYCEQNKEHLVRRKLQDAGAQIINFNFDFAGLQIWKA